MSLATYHKKRRFDVTPEPHGQIGRKPKKEPRFVVQKHDASRLHYDFRLEAEGVLKSWAVPKGPSLDPSHKTLAVQVEDHPLEYGDFEGVIPRGQYGGGTVLLWDTGTWEPLHDPIEGLNKGKLHFRLHGQKLKGEWSLVRMHGKAGGDGKNWLLMKLQDQYAGTDDVIHEESKSVKTSRSIDQIADARDDVWSGDAKQVGKITGAVKAPLPEKFSPQLAVLAEVPPSGEQWLHEIKFDGYRIIARISNGKVRLITRNGNDYTDHFPHVASALSKLKADSAIVDGEMVVLDKNGRSDFEAMQMLMKEPGKCDPVYYTFDLPYCDGFDLRDASLIDRKKQLEMLLTQSNLRPRVFYSEHVQGDGSTVIHKACGMQLEGIISKQADARYVSRRDPSWLKSKCGQRQELVVIGYTDPKGSRAGFGSLLLGYHDDHGQLVYAGRVGTGFDDRLLKDTVAKLRKLKQGEPPTDVPPPRREEHNAHWVKPTLVAEVNFAGWTRDGVMRHPAFLGFRTDKPAEEIVREKPVNSRQIRSLESLTKSKFAKGQNKSERPVARKVSKKPVSNAAATAGVVLSHPDKSFYPDSGTTKRDLADYYNLVQRWMLPHMVDRPLALVRCPEGISAKCFFQRNWTGTLPKAIDKVDIGQGKREFHVCIHNLAGLISMAQLGVLEIHTWNCRIENVERPDQLVFDLDPGPDLPWKQTIKAARLVQETLESLHLPVFLKTSGGKGLHLTTPIEPNIDWDSAKSFCQTLCKSLADGSDLFVANMRKDLRGGKVYLDYNRNGRSATAVAPYSTRGRANAPVSMPITWNELGKLKSAEYFTVANAAQYLGKRKADPWRGFEESRVDLLKVIGRKSAA